MGDHYVPRYYLKGFANDDAIWAFDRRDRRAFQTQTKSIANETGMYGPHLETRLTEEIEQPAMSAIEKVRSRERLSPSDREPLARYIAMLWKRVPRGRERVAGGVPEVAASLLDKYAAELQAVAADDPSLADLAERRLAELHAAVDKLSADPTPIWRSVLDKERASTTIVEVLLAMNWTFLCSDRLQFLTCDNPVFFFELEGRGKPLSELTLPFSDSVAMWATWRRRPEAINARAEAVRAINRRTANNATRFVYARSAEDWVLPFVLKAPGHALSRLA